MLWEAWTGGAPERARRGPLPAEMSIEQIKVLVTKSKLDWQRGFVAFNGNGSVNLYAVLARFAFNAGVLAAHEGGSPAQPAESALLPPPAYTHAEVRALLDGISADAKTFGLEVIDRLNGAVGLQRVAAPVQRPGIDVAREAIEERDAMEQRYHDLAEHMVYQGNSVSWWHSKATAYRDAIDAVWDALRAAGIQSDGNKTCADGVRELAARAAPAQSAPVSEPLSVA
jgi:hypothetical protein